MLLVQKIVNHINSSVSTWGTGTLASVPSPGNLLVACFMATPSSADPDMGNQSQPAGWALAQDCYETSGQDGYTAIFYKIAGGSEAQQFDFETGEADVAIVALYEFSGVASNPLDQTAFVKPPAEDQNATITCSAKNSQPEMLGVAVWGAHKDASTDLALDVVSGGFTLEDEEFNDNWHDINGAVALKYITELETTTITVDFGGTYVSHGGVLAMFRSARARGRESGIHEGIYRGIF